MIIKKYKDTKQRKLILSILKRTRSHPGAEWIYEEARKQIPRISQGTVYRNLLILLEQGKITSLIQSGTITRYELKLPLHYHFRCDRCGQVVDVNIPLAQELNIKASKSSGLKVDYHQLEFHGSCVDCQTKI